MINVNSISRIEVSPKHASMDLGGPKVTPFVACAFDNKGEIIEAARFRWSLDNPHIAHIDPDTGEMDPLEAGTCGVVAEYVGNRV